MSQIPIRKDVKVECVPDLDHLMPLVALTPQVISEGLFREATRIREDILCHLDYAHPRVTYRLVNACEFCGDESNWKGEPAECCQKSLDQIRENA